MAGGDVQRLRPSRLSHFRFTIWDFRFQDNSTPLRRGRVLQSKIENPKSKIRACLGPGALLCILLLLVAPGCTIFPQGSYWPPLAARHEPGAPLPQAQAHLFQSPAATPAEAAARRAALQAAITQRWSGEDLARSARAMNGWAGRAVYADALQTVVWFYVDPVTYRQLVVAGLESLRAAMDNADFRRRFPEAEPADKRELLIRALDALILEAYAANPVLAWQAAGWAEEAMASSRRLLGLPDGVVVAEMLFGAMDYMVKPFDLDTLTAKINKAAEISKKRAPKP